MNKLQTLLLGFIIIITIFAVSIDLLRWKKADIPSSAEYNELIKPKKTPTTACTQLPKDVPVLVLEFYPEDPHRPGYLEPEETGWKDNNYGGRSISYWEGRTQSLIQEATTIFNEGTRYHGYKDPSAPQYLNYKVIQSKKFYTDIPRGYKVAPDQGYLPNYGKILKENDICSYVESRGVREVWMFGYHSKTIVPNVSRMSHKDGIVDFSYDENQKENSTEYPAEFKMPNCKKTYTLYNFTYGPTNEYWLENIIRNRLFQIGHLMSVPDNYNFGKYTAGSLYWDDFSENVQPGKVRSSYKSSCGSTLYAPNWKSTGDSYNYSIYENGESNCETWEPEDSRTHYEKINCTRWGCTAKGFYLWHMQNMPGYNNKIEYKGEYMKNWWDAIYDFDTFYIDGPSLLSEEKPQQCN